MIEIESTRLWRDLPDCDDTINNRIVILKLIDKVYLGGIQNIIKPKSIDTTVSDKQVKWIQSNFTGSKYVFRFLLFLTNQVQREHRKHLKQMMLKVDIIMADKIQKVINKMENKNDEKRYNYIN